MKLDDKQIKAACMMIDLGEFTRIEIAKKFNISKSYLDKLYRERNEKSKDSFNEKNILDDDEVRLVNKTLMLENEELRLEMERLEKKLEDAKIISATPIFMENAKEIKPENVQKFVEKCKIMADIYERKNKKYGNSFTKTYQEYGKPVLCIRLEDKLSRIKQLLLNGQEGTADESVTDTLIDMANYAIMAVMELER